MPEEEMLAFWKSAAQFRLRGSRDEDMAIEDMVDIALETGAVDNRDDPPQSGSRVEGDGPTHTGDSTPLVSSMQTVGGGMVAFEFSSEGVIGDDMVLDDDRWRWRHTVSYWVCVCYILGSMLFVAGSAFWYKHYVHESRERALVVYPFLLGSILFTLGGYLGVFQAINLGRRGTSKLWEWSPEKDGFLGYWFYFVGALVFNVSCIEPLELFADWPDWLKREMAWGAAEVGSLCFIAGAFVEVRTTKSLNVFEAVESGRWRKLPFWLSWNNLFGGCLFFTAATAGRWDPTSPGWVYTTYLIGSVNFFIASSIMLWLWKEEQYGLGFIPSINRIVPLRPLEAGKGYRQVSLWHFAFIQVYITLTGASFIDFCFATQRFSVYEQYHGFAHFHEAVASLMGVFLAVGLLFMGSVLHTTPRIHPFDKLLYWVQVYVAVKLIQILISIEEYYTVALSSDEKEAAGLPVAGGCTYPNSTLA